MDGTKSVTERLLERRSWTMENLKTAIKGLNDSVNSLERKISTSGLDAHYSVNSDVLRWARKVHSAEHSLSLLHELLVYAHAADDIIEVSNKETTDAQEKQKEEDSTSETSELDSS